MNPTAANPFVGIRPFESTESLLFFGRQEQTMELLQRLHQYHFVAVTGGSGSGKSSLIRAGLIPSLKAGYLVNERDRWMIALMKPGQSPLNNLAEAVLDQIKNNDKRVDATTLVAAIKEKGADALLEVLEPLWGANTNFFLLVDQFEELFRFSMDGDDLEKKNEATEFVNILLALSAQKELPIYIVITMRSDFVGDCANFYGLPEAMNQSQYIVPRLNRLQLKSTIEGPVKLYNGNIHPSLTTRLLNDVQVVKDELPLLQHALMRIWDYETKVDKSGALDLNDYEKIGGIEKALSNHADEALAGMSEEELTCTKKIFQALTVIDERGRKVRRPVRLSELENITGASTNELLSIINKFIEGNRSFLIISKLDGNDKLIDIAHESLIRQWNTLNNWVEEEGESGKIFLRLTESALLYNQKKKDLLMGNELQPVLLWYHTFKPGNSWAKRYSSNYENSFAYLQQSEAEWQAAERRKKQRRKNLFTLMYSAIALAFLLLGWFLLRENKLRNDAVLAKEAASKDAEAAMLARDSLQASLNVEKAKSKKIRNHYDTLSNTIRETLLDSLSLHDSLVDNQYITKINTVYIDTATNNERQRLERRRRDEAASLQLMQIAFKEVQKNPTIALRLAEAALQKSGYSNNALYYLTNKMYRENAFYKTVYNYGECPLLHSLSPDGSRMLSLVKGKGKLLNVATGETTEFKGINQKIYALTFSPDGTLLLGGSDDGTATLWAADGTVKSVYSFKGDTGVVRSVAFSPAGNAVVIAVENSNPKLYDLTGKLITVFETKGATVLSATFSPDGSKLFFNLQNKAPELWNADGKLIRTLKTVQDKISSVAFSPDGKKVVTGFTNGLVRLWDADGYLLQEFREKGRTGFISSVVFSKDGTKILTASQDGTARLWHVNGYLVREFKGEMNSLLTAAFTPDEKKVYTGSLDGTVRVWDISGTFDKYNGAYNPALEVTTFLEGNKMLDLLTPAQKSKYGIE